MRELGLCMCGRSLKELTFNEILNPYGHDISGIMMFCGFELILKSIVEEKDSTLLKRKSGYTINCKDAYKIVTSWHPELQMEKENELFDKMNDFRNGMIHEGDGEYVNPIEFWYKIVEKITINVLKTSTIYYFGLYDPDGIEYIIDNLKSDNIILNENDYQGVLDKDSIKELFCKDG